VTAEPAAALPAAVPPIARPAQPRHRRWDRLCALALAVVTISWMLAVEGRQGIGRDEAQYFRAGARYWEWFEALGTNLKSGRLGASFAKEGVLPFWSDNPEHPPLMKTLYGISWRLFHECGPNRTWHPLPASGPHRTLALFKRESSAFRFPAILMAGLGAAMVFFFARLFMGRTAAAAASIMSVAQPHYFFHAQIACFDAPITTMAVVVGFAYWKSLASARWGILCGMLFGVALVTKHNAWLMPFFLGAHYLWMRRGDLRRLRPPRIPLVFVAMITIGPLVALALWPLMWSQPIAGPRWYFLRHLQHEHYHFEYLGRNWSYPPIDLDLKLLRMTFPFVTTLFTVPVTTLALALAGAVVLWRRWRSRSSDVLPIDVPGSARVSWLRPGADVDRAPGMFFAMQILGPMAVVALPSTPIFGGAKHFMPAMPYLAILAGLGVAWVGRALVALPLQAWFAREKVRRLWPVALAAALVLPSVVETRRSHPDGLAHYNWLAGGFAGGASLGMNRQFWGYSVLPMLGWMNAHLPASRSVYWHDVLQDALTMYVRDGRMPAWPGYSGVGEEAIEHSDLGIVIHERHMALYEGVFWDSYGTTKPAYVRTREGVPIVTVYRRPGTGGAP
jgi:4-amino-4-deoxy-L-arabinose transferase-like glycosyltransferase